MQLLCNLTLTPQKMTDVFHREFELGGKAATGVLLVGFSTNSVKKPTRWRKR
jgi:hypothetical protein